MKKFFKILLGVFTFIFVGLVATMLILGKEYHFERKITINAPVDKVWENVNSVKAINQWNPWLKIDPNMKMEFSGTSGQVGDSYSWESKNPDAGKGKQTITGLHPKTLVNTDLTFYMPEESKAKADIKLIPQGNQTEVIWTLDSTFEYPSNLMKLFFDSFMDAPYTEGLKKLKEISEK